MTNPAQPEPSMEEILASIRRIISEDPATAPAAPAAEPVAEVPAPQPEPVAPSPAPVQAAPEPPAPPPVQDDVFELTPAMRSDTFTPPAPEPMPEPVPTPEPEPVPEPPVYTPPEPAPMAYNNDDDNSIMSPHTEAVASAALAGLAHSITSRTGFEGGTVEDVVRELLRPMLRDWMDANLPTLVERLVEAEIEKLSRRRG